MTVQHRARPSISLDSIVNDARYALRTMRRQKMFTLLAALCLALGIGANTTVFSFIESILFRELPVDRPDDLVIVQWTARPPGEGVPWGIQTRGGLVSVGSRLRGDAWPYPVFEQFRERRELFAEVFGYLPVSQLPVDDGAVPPADGLYVTGNFFLGLGLQARAGRLLIPTDDAFDAPTAVVLSSAFSEERFGSAEAAVGRTVRLNGVAFTVVGVAPAGFFGLDPERPPSFYLPMRSGPLVVAATPGVDFPALVGNSTEMYQAPRLFWVSTWGRLQPEVTREQAQAALRVPFEAFFAANAATPEALGNTPQLELASGASGIDGLRTRYAETLTVLFAMVGVILAVACASIASLLLARAAARRREIAIRISLGVGRWGVVRQLLTESILLALIGGAAGVALSVAGTRFLGAWLATGFDAALFRADLNLPVLVFTLGVSVLTGILFGLAPALQAAKVDPFPALKGSRSDTEHSGGRRHLGFGRALVVAQIALALVLLVGATLFTTTLAQLRATDLGFNQEGLLLASVDARRAGYTDNTVRSFFASLQERLAQVPGIDSASMSWSALAGGGAYVRPATVPGGGARSTDINVQVIGPSFFETMQIDILAGRSISEEEVESAVPVAVVDRNFASTFFPGTDPIDKLINVEGEGDLRVVGVSANARHDQIRSDVRPVVYFSYTWDPHPLSNMVAVLRTRGEPMNYADTLRAAVWELNPQVSVGSVRTQVANTDRTINREILFARLSDAFAFIALVIACVGLYGTVSYGMARRTSEIGIRMALGATRFRLLRFALAQVLALGLAGIAMGVPLAMLASRYIERFLWGVSSTDPLPLAGSAIAVLLAVALAGYAPANRASRVQPMKALRTE